ncbi:MAG: hypothetical protein K0V04_02145 [Deltaproteobacteria bacterium]|nr:hypothetical protein [Deltaproteobacteria bacterium]
MIALTSGCDGLAGLLDGGEEAPAEATPATASDPPAASSQAAAEAGRQPDPQQAGEDGGAPAVLAAVTPTLPKPAAPPASEQAGTCPTEDADHVGLLVSPARPAAGQPLRIMAATLSEETMLALRIEDAEGQAVEAEITHHAGVPAATIARLVAPEAGVRLSVTVGRDGTGLACRTITIRRPRTRRPPAESDRHVWPVKREWDGAEEALYSAWVRALFHVPRGDDLATSALHLITTEPDRNLLHDHLSWGEDAAPTKLGLYLRPDCADTPYFLRAYYAWKRRLPFGFRRCSRGRGGRAPTCGALRGVASKPENPPVKRLAGELGAVQRYFKRTLAWGVHTGNGRTAHGDDSSDFYPLELSRSALRPGTIYADPYGHIFVLAEWMPAEGTMPGVLYAIDGQPDGSITRKRFWEGNFLWNPDPALGGSGFKGFRPHRIEGRGEQQLMVAATDAELATLPGYRDIDTRQGERDAPAFYDHMDALITPGVRDPFRAQQEAIQALFESAKVRVTSVDNGVANQKSGSTVKMPTGFSIFETTGAWENYSTPARDLRLLIAIDVATGFAAKVARSPEGWGVEAAGGLEAVRTRLIAERDELLADPKLAFEYTRSDGTPWTLTLAELVARVPAFTTAYNPNDCPEVRWAAPEGSEEHSTCRRRAPEDQRRKMEAYQLWFEKRQRPPRGDPGPPVD